MFVLFSAFRQLLGGSLDSHFDHPQGSLQTGGAARSEFRGREVRGHLPLRDVERQPMGGRGRRRQAARRRGRRLGLHDFKHEGRVLELTVGESIRQVSSVAYYF